MAKAKTTSYEVPAPAQDVLTKLKDAAVIKPSQTVRAKLTETVKLVASREDKKTKSKMATEPTPELGGFDYEDKSDDSARPADNESKEETGKPIEPNIDQHPPQQQRKPQKKQQLIPWASTNKGIGVMTRKRRKAEDLKTAGPSADDAVFVAQNQTASVAPDQSSSPEPQTTGLGKGKTVPIDRRNPGPKARRHNATGPKVRKPHLDRLSKLEKTARNITATDQDDLQRSTPSEDEVKSTPAGDRESEIDQNDLEGGTPGEDQEGAIDENDPVGSMLVEYKEYSDSESDSAVDDIDNL